MVLDAPEVYLSQINASDCTVVHGAIVDDTVCHICGRCPLGGTWTVSYTHLTLPTKLEV